MGAGCLWELLIGLDLCGLIGVLDTTELCTLKGFNERFREIRTLVPYWWECKMVQLLWQTAALPQKI